MTSPNRTRKQMLYNEEFWDMEAFSRLNIKKSGEKFGT
jgi:hypothetical protein